MSTTKGEPYYSPSVELHNRLAFIRSKPVKSSADVQALEVDQIARERGVDWDTASSLWMRKQNRGGASR